jgi:hypothetical protein
LWDRPFQLVEPFVTDYSGHNVAIEQPDVVIETIRRVVEETRGRERR